MVATMASIKMTIQWWPITKSYWNLINKNSSLLAKIILWTSIKKGSWSNQTAPLILTISKISWHFLILIEHQLEPWNLSRKKEMTSIRILLAVIAKQFARGSSIESNLEIKRRIEGKYKCPGKPMNWFKIDNKKVLRNLSWALLKLRRKMKVWNSYKRNSSSKTQRASFHRPEKEVQYRLKTN